MPQALFIMIALCCNSNTDLFFKQNKLKNTIHGFTSLTNNMDCLSDIQLNSRGPDSLRNEDMFKPHIEHRNKVVTNQKLNEGKKFFKSTEHKQNNTANC